MVTALTVAVLLSCKPAPSFPQPPPVTSACEGADRVTRNHDGLELSRQQLACTVARCEGRDWVVRSTDGVAVTRVPMRCAPPTPRVDVLRFGLSYR